MAGTGTYLAGFVARPTDPALIWEAPRRTLTHASVVQSIVLACDALGGPFPVTTLRVALGVAVVQYLSRGVERLVADWDEEGGESKEEEEEVSPGSRLVRIGAEEPSNVATDAWTLDAAPTYGYPW